MITDYPPFYEGELLSSYLYRYHAYTGYSNFSDTALEMWGKRGKWVTSILFPANAISIIKQLGISEDEYIDKHTVLKFYKAFLQEEKCKGIEQEMLYSSRVHISTLRRNIFMDYDSTTFNYCPKCIKDNNNILIIKREHQIPGVCVCALHECFLEKYVIRNRRDRIDFNGFEFTKNIITNDNRMLANVSKHVSYLFKETKLVEFTELVAFLKTVLIAEGILSKDGHSNISKEILLKKSFDDGPEIYRSIMCACSLEQIINLTSYSIIKPLIYILIINKLFNNYESFYKEAFVKNNY